MTPGELIFYWLSFDVWLRRTILPAAATLILLLLMLTAAHPEPLALKQGTVIITFFVVYFAMVRAGHMVMIRAMHFDLLKNFPAAYKRKLALLPRDLRHYNLGFTLARIKRELINEAERT